MFTTRRKGIIALLCAVFAAALIACAISLAPSASRTAPVYAAEGYVAAIDDTNYTSLKGAIDAAGDTATTITLLTNTAENITIASEQVITLELDKYDITVETGNAITNNGTLTITGIKTSAIISTEDPQGYAVSNNGTLAIEGAFADDISNIDGGTVSISGGRFANPVPASYLGDGYNSLGYYTTTKAGFDVRSEAAVAQITRGGVEYVFRNLAAADAGAVDGDIIQLLNDITTTGSIDKDNAITLSKSVTLDLCGFDITFTATNYSNNLIGVTGGNVVITNSSKEESKLINTYGEGSNAYSVIHSEGANLTIKNVTIESDANGVVFFGSLTPAAASVADPVTFNTLNMEGVKVSAYAFALSGNGSSAEDEAWSGTTINVTNSSLNSDQGCAIYQPQYGILNINGEETFIEGSSGIEVRAGILNVYAGTIRADWSEFTVYENAGGGSSVDGAAIVVSQHSTNLPISVNLNGGTYSSNSAGGMSVYEADLLNDVATDKIEIAIDGGEYTQPVESKNVKGFVENGTFANAFDESFVAEGSVFYPAEDGTYKVVTEEEFETVTDNAGVALMNGVVYDSLADAVDAAPTDGTQVTITLIDTDGDGIVTGSGVKVVEGKNIVIDFDGLTYDVTNPTVGSPGTETNGFQLLKGSTVRMMNGTLVSDAALILIQNYCDLTVDDMTLDMSDCAQVQYVISNNFGNTVITGDTTIVAAPNQVAFDIYYGLGATYYDGVSVTFDENFTGSVTGKVEYGASAGGAGQEGWLDKTQLTIESGTFDIDLFVHSNNTEMTEEEADEATITISGGKFSTKFSDSYLADGYALSEYNGYYIPISSSTDGTLLEEIAQLRQEIDEAIAAINGELEGGDAATLADAVTALIGKMNELEDKIAELDENMVTDADLQALRNSITVAYNAAVSRVRAELSAQISDLRDSMAEMGDVSGQLDELRAAYEAADELLSADIADVSAELEAAISELESAYGEADDAIWNAIYALRDADSGMTTALWVIGVIAVLALCAGVAGVAFAIVRTKRS